MKKRTRKLLWAGLALAVVLGLVWQFYDLPGADARLEALPTEGETFYSQPLPLSAVESEMFGEARVVKRLYYLDGVPIVVTVVDGTRNRHGVHDPLHCYIGDGWRLLDEQPFALPWGGHARRARLARGGEVAEIVYWYSTGEATFTGALAYWAATATRRVSLGYSGPEPVMVVLQQVADRDPQWEKTLAAHREVFDI